MTSTDHLGSRPVSRARGIGRAIPPTWLVMIAVWSTQLGSSFAKHLFQALTPGGTALLRVGVAAVVLVAIWRPRLGKHSVREYGMAALFGLALAGMNLSFYSALDRIPLGIAVTLEFAGPLSVAVIGSRRTVDFLWVVLAATGIALLTPWGGLRLDPLGVGLALLAGTLWASYIVLSARVGKIFPGGQGLAIAMAVGTCALAPIGVSTGGSALLHPGLILAGSGVALLSSVIPYSLELEALRALPTRVFGVLMSIEPASAAIFGFLVLGEVLQPRALVAIVLVSAATFGAARSASAQPVP
jgi:inner membrane transporter RhtA